MQGGAAADILMKPHSALSLACGTAISLRPAHGQPYAPVQHLLGPMYSDCLELDEADGRFAGEGFTAWVDDTLAAAMFWVHEEGLAPGEELTYLYGGTAEPWRRRGIGALMLDRAIAHIRARSAHGTLIIGLPPADRTPAPPQASPANRPFWQSRGFSLMDVQLSFYGQAQDFPPEPPEEPLQSLLYCGGDAEIDAALISLVNRMLGSRVGVPPMTQASLAHELARPDYRHLLLMKGPHLAAAAIMMITDTYCYVETVVVDRRFWGRGTADVLGRAINRTSIAHGCTVMTAQVASTNAAVQGLLRRFGWQPYAETTRLRTSWANPAHAPTGATHP